MSVIPEKITGMVTVSYAAKNIAKQLSENNPDEEVSVEDVMKVILEWSVDDLKKASEVALWIDEKGDPIDY